MRDRTTGQPWWEASVGDLARVSVQRTQLNPRLYPLTAPHVRATDEQVTDAETRLGTALDEQHRALLRTGNGWPDVFSFSDLLSTDELGQGPLWERANERLDVLYEDGDVSGWPPRDELMPFVVSPHDSDVFVIWTHGPTTEGGHPVLWIANELVDQWPNVYEWLLGMTELARRSRDRQAQKLGLHPPE